GSFAPMTYPQPDLDYLQEMVITDLNGDGHADLVAADWWFNTANVFLGDGSGALGAPVLYGANPQAEGLEVADVNEDGEPDLIAIGGLTGFITVIPHASPNPVPALFSVTKAVAYPDRVELAWYSSMPPGTPVTVSRTDGLTGWTPVDKSFVDGS